MVEEPQFVSPSPLAVAIYDHKQSQGRYILKFSWLTYSPLTQYSWSAVYGPDTFRTETARFFPKRSDVAEQGADGFFEG
jgi:hypothetical protein